jgi:hypothetical protein
MLISKFKTHVEAKYSGSCLQFQHSGGWSRRIGIWGQVGLHSELEANLGYLARPCLKQSNKMKQNKKIEQHFLAGACRNMWRGPGAASWTPPQRFWIRKSGAGPEDLHFLLMLWCRAHTLNTERGCLTLPPSDTWSLPPLPLFMAVNLLCGPREFFLPRAYREVLCQCFGCGAQSGHDCFPPATWLTAL